MTASLVSIRIYGQTDPEQLSARIEISSSAPEYPIEGASTSSVGVVYKYLHDRNRLSCMAIRRPVVPVYNRVHATNPTMAASAGLAGGLDQLAPAGRDRLHPGREPEQCCHCADELPSFDSKQPSKVGDIQQTEHGLDRDRAQRCVRSIEEKRQHKQYRQQHEPGIYQPSRTRLSCTSTTIPRLYRGGVLTGIRA